MGARYSSTPVIGHNSSPPSDDGAQTESNRVTWAKLKEKLSDPIKAALESINTKLVTAFDFSARAVSTSDSTVAGDHMRTIQISSAATTGVTISLGDAATMAAGYIVNIYNGSAFEQTIGRQTASDTINGSTANGVIPPLATVRAMVNQAVNGYTVAFSTAPQAPGSILDFAGTSVPTGYLACDGSNVSRTTYAALFAAIGTTWGAGNGSTTFGLPDFRRRVAVGSGGSGSGTLGNAVGNTGGEETHVLTVPEMPAHSHTVDSANVATGSDTTVVTAANTGVGNNTPPTSQIGGGGAHNNLQPSAVVLKIIKT